MSGWKKMKRYENKINVSRGTVQRTKVYNDTTMSNQCSTILN